MNWTEALNAREWVTVIWGGVALVVMLAVPDIRASMLNVVRVMFSRTLVVPATAMLLYIAAVTFAASRVDLWEARLLGATLAWVVASALLGFFQVLRVPEDPHYLRSALRRAVEIAAVVDAYVNLFVLPFPAEMLLVPFLVLLAMLIAAAEVSPELQTNAYDSTRSCLKSLMGIFGIAILVYATIHVVGELSSGKGLGELGRSLILPLWLNLVLIPFTFLLALWVVYQSAFVMLGAGADATPASKRRAKLALLLEVRLRPYALGTFGPPWPDRFSHAASLADARRVARELVHGQTAASVG